MNADRINEFYYGDPASPMTQRTRERIHWICSQATGQDVLDIGCSQGIVCLTLGREGFRCAGVDIEAASLDIAREALAKEDELVRRRVKFDLADASELPFADQSFDTVILGEILEHLTQPSKVLAEAKRVLRDGGRLVVTVPYGLNSFHDHKTTYYPTTLLEMLQAWFKTTSVDTFSHYLTYTGSRDASYDPQDVNQQISVQDYQRLAKAVEARCLEMERALEKTKSQRKEVKALTAKLAAEMRRIAELEQSLSSRTQQIDGARAAVNERSNASAGQDHDRQQIANLQAAIEAEKNRIQALEADNAQLRDALLREQTELNRRLALAEVQHAERLRARERHFQELLAKREAELHRQAVNQRIRDLVRATLPPDAHVLIISKGDDDLLRLDGRHGAHFPRGPGGVYAGYHPATAADAISHLDALKARGAQYLLIPGTAFWWLEYYADFHDYLQNNCTLLMFEASSCAIYALRGPTAGQPCKALTDARNGRLPDPRPAPAPAPEPSVNAISDRQASPASRDSNGIQLAAILDEFTADCLRPECNLITFRPDNWRKVLEQNLPDALFVESAWRGNEGAWLYRIANYQRDMGNELADLLKWANKLGIPTIFWNKEDPVHFDRFIERAKLFSHVFTTDADCIPRYREVLRHDRIWPLPFAAQPAIHHPIQTEPRSGSVCFAGTYYGNRHGERQADMEYILRPAIPFGLEIYDRQHGMNGKGADSYRFPEIYQPYIKGRLDYDEMVKAYKRYRVFLNVNSVKQSPTMFSRRVFELLACGTPVISTYSQGLVEMLGDDVVFITESDADTERHLERLLGDEEEWGRASARGIRKVLRDHTYRHRLNEVFVRAGVTSTMATDPRLSVVVRLQSDSDMACLAELLAEQSYQPFNVVAISENALSTQRINEFRNALANISIVTVDGPPIAAFDKCVGLLGDYVAFIDTRDSYGADYLLDGFLALRYADCPFIGKHTFYRAVSTGTPTLRQEGHEYRHVTSVQSGTLIARTDALTQHLFSHALSRRVFRSNVQQFLSLDRFNYVQDGKLENAPTKTPADGQKPLELTL